MIKSGVINTHAILIDNLHLNDNELRSQLQSQNVESPFTSH